ncbi:uncharacterized protein VNE69_08157 [Vairimorpha necatrix]|uniref:Uncharacterized protein n=1 Tax=Vairimorpha necatrix TaxID=6039 RepID=A0AAX4JEH7_9MICR
MFFYILSVICSEIKDIKSEILDRTEENNHYKIKNPIFPKCQNLFIEKNIRNNKQFNAPDSISTSNSRYNPYKREKGFFGEGSGSSALVKPLDLSFKSTKTENINSIAKYCQFTIEKRVEEYNNLLKQLKSLISTWEHQDSQFRDISSRLEFGNRSDQGLYYSSRAKVYPWVKNHGSIVHDYLIRILELILKSKTDQNIKILLYRQIQFIYEAMFYVQKLLPFKENYKPISIELSVYHIRLVYRLPILYRSFNFLDAFLDFCQTLKSYHNVQDPICLEILTLIEPLRRKISSDSKHLNTFIYNIDQMIVILEKAQLSN